MSKLTEEIKKLSKKLDDIDRRVELIEDKQPKITVKVSTGCDSSVSTSNPKFKVGDRFIPHKPKNWNGSLSWTKEMDEYDCKVLTVAHIAPDGDIQSDTNKGWYFSPSWCTKGEEPYFPKEGEYAYVLSSDSGHNYVTIFSRKENGYLYDKCSINLKTNELWDGNISPLIRIDAIIDFRPASAEEKKLLDAKLAEKGLIFDGKEVVKDNTPKIGDFCIFWDYDKGGAFCAILEKIINYCEGKYITRIGIGYRNCIKFESVEQYKNFLKEQ